MEDNFWHTNRRFKNSFKITKISNIIIIYLFNNLSMSSSSNIESNLRNN